MPSPVESFIARASALALLAVAASFAIGQQRAPARFAGVWNAEHRGKTFVILKLKNSEPPSGSIAAGNVRADDAGRVIEVEEEARNERPLGDIAEKDAVLSFSSRDNSGEIIRYEMRLIGEKEAELRILEAPIQPFTLRKQ